MLTPATDGFA